MPTTHGGRAAKNAGDIVATQLPADNDRASRINPVHLKDVLGDIQTDCDNLFHGRLSLM